MVNLAKSCRNYPVSKAPHLLRADIEDWFSSVLFSILGWMQRLHIKCSFCWTQSAGVMKHAQGIKSCMEQTAGPSAGNGVVRVCTQGGKWSNMHNITISSFASGKTKKSLQQLASELEWIGQNLHRADHHAPWKKWTQFRWDEKDGNLKQKQ